DNDHEDGSANSAAADIGKNALHIHSASARGCRSHHALEDRSAKPASDNPGDRVADRAQTFVFHRCACDVAADCATDRFNNQVSDVQTPTSLTRRGGDDIGLKAYASFAPLDKRSIGSSSQSAASCRSWKTRTSIAAPRFMTACNCA